MAATVIIGAGPAGLGAAHALGPDHDLLILERGAAAGGLCSSFTVGGATFDLGGHAFFTKLAETDDIITRHAAQPLYRQRRNAWVHSYGTFVPYPFQSNLFGLPVDVVKHCVLGAVEQRMSPSGRPPRTLAQWIEQSFGAGIAEHFMTPYNAKLWAFPLADIEPSWTGDRIVQPDLDAIVEGALHRRDYTAFPNAMVRYPSHGGFVELYRPFIDAFADRTRLRTEVVGVDLDAREVLTADGRIPYQDLVTTAVLGEFAAVCSPMPPRLRAAALGLKHNSLYLVSLAVKPAAADERHRIYVADPDVPFHKLVLNSNSSPELRAAPAFGIQAEVSFSEHKQVSPAGLTEDVVDALVAMGLLRSADDVVESDLRTVEYAYPVQTSDTASVVAELRDYLGRYGVHLAGRFAEWTYVNSDAAFQRGLDIGRRLRGSGPTPADTKGAGLTDV